VQRLTPAGGATGPAALAAAGVQQVTPDCCATILRRFGGHEIGVKDLGRLGVQGGDADDR